MKKRTYLTLAVIVLTTCGGVFGWTKITSSNSTTPEESKFASTCSSGQGSDATYNRCCIDYNEAIDAAEKDWQTNLNRLVDQQKPASQMVDEAYENLRTYNCWLEYICRGVEYSGYAPIQSSIGTGLTSDHIGRVPGCQLPENLKMDSNYNEFTQGMKKVPLLGSAIVLKDNLYIQNKISFFPSCMSDPINNQSPSVAVANANFQACKLTIESKFGCNNTDVLSNPEKFKDCMESSNTIVKMETALKRSAADQKASALERKMTTIVNKMNSMQEHVGYLSNFLKQLDLRLPCFAKVCT